MNVKRQLRYVKALTHLVYNESLEIAKQEIHLHDFNWNTEEYIYASNEKRHRLEQIQKRLKNLMLDIALLEAMQ